MEATKSTRPLDPATFEVTVTGKAEIPHPAERGLINVTVASAGQNKAAVSDEVVTTAKHIEALLSELCPKDDSPEAKAASPLAHWDKTSLSATSYVPRDKDGNEKPRQYDASVTFDIRFKEFKALGRFGTKVSSLNHVEVQNISWILTAETEKSFQSKLRRDAAKDAMDKARDYCEVLQCTNLRPIELEEGRSHTGVYRPNYSYGMSQDVGSRRMHQSAQASMQSMQRARQSHPGSDSRSEDLEFRPQEVRLSMDVTIKFHADPATARSA
ncbi:hypothetical protein CLAFUW4_04923 [Fulvia fulva]|uniref:Uncharacterized protein n=1 Tax=Passalora fulva TaxID=5499 RepID=A0A9Q8PHD4_PASFU|nr:uncharacterized protein CLAFUR5_11982 [Fulvia fulva]KAK4626598.1 hypothetical protein CLAFUR4_04909 [Fulvia fulva]KAK4628585.1 hypothetical protein CLAFUR0_04913 [Fulvia fulva]UJO22462.1 hypothetical protein CLAFUR5_11982 [Fulvia fulva]WPV13748.1 hypothetical protein CLAFUW4_04923 [Fulvia fulva]WPV28876.1 hypothetical protein CLAFUW7_04917 [Fulvia fulva]